LIGGLLFNVFYIAINWIEYYTVGILKDINDYPFGGEGPVPYYYKSSELYAQINLTWGLIFSLNFILLVVSLIKGVSSFRTIMLIVTWILIVTKIMHGLIGVI
jgi:hypothetical protein